MIMDNVPREEVKILELPRDPTLEVEAGGCVDYHPLPSPPPALKGGGDGYSVPNPKKYMISNQY